MELSMEIIACHPVQNGDYLAEYCNDVVYYHTIYGLIQNFCKNFDDKHNQNTFLTNLDNSWKIIHEFDIERKSSNPTESDKYKDGGFLHEFRNIISKLDLDKGVCGPSTVPYHPSSLLIMAKLVVVEDLIVLILSLKVSTNFILKMYTKFLLIMLIFLTLLVFGTIVFMVWINLLFLQKIRFFFVNAIDNISKNMNYFDSTKFPCAICVGKGHEFNERP